MRLRKVILWLPALILVVASVAVTLILVTSNTKRISNLEDQQNSSVITFTFTQQTRPGTFQRFRIICKLDTNNSSVYICSTIPGTPTTRPTPSLSPGG